MSELLGRWAATLRTPIGSIDADFTFTERDGVLSGYATGKGETVPLEDVTVVEDDGGRRVRWTQAITKPLRLNLAFDVVVRGEEMTGHSRAGRLPRSTVAGRRR